MASAPVIDSIASDRDRIEASLSDLLPDQTSSVNRAMQYSVLGCGQRLRPILSLRTARALDCDGPVPLRLAASVELLHCASLIIDDLPCMDNDLVRRNRAAVHVQFGEATAILAAFALVALAAKSVADHTCFQLKLLGTLDCDALIGGQALDLELAGNLRDADRACVAAMKTVPLFELAAEAGCLGSSVHAEERRAAAAFGREYGIAYQLLDDYLDGEVAELDRVLQQIEGARSCLRIARPAGLSLAGPAGSSEWKNLARRSQSSVAASVDWRPRSDYKRAATKSI